MLIANTVIGITRVNVASTARAPATETAPTASGIAAAVSDPKASNRMIMVSGARAIPRV